MAFGLSSSNPGVEGELAVGSQKGFSLKYDFLVIKYFHWAFRSSFSAVFCSGALAFFSLTLLFAVLIYLSGINKPSCIHVNGVDFGTTGANFMDAYALSWTTFSTVVRSSIFHVIARNIVFFLHLLFSDPCLTTFCRDMV